MHGNQFELLQQNLESDLPIYRKKPLAKVKDNLSDHIITNRLGLRLIVLYSNQTEGLQQDMESRFTEMNTVTQSSSPALAVMHNNQFAVLQ